MKYSNDGLVSFDEQTHTYWKGDNRLTSVTSFIGKYKNKFDSDYHSKRIAEKRGVSQEEVLKEWKDKADKSTTMGTFIHKIFEDFTMSLPYKNSGTYPKEAIAISIIEDLFLSGRLTPIGCEMIVYNNYLAGQIDNVSKDKEDNLYILDWKTNSEISRNNYGKYMLDELSAIPDCAFYHYSLQLSIYKKLHGSINRCYIIHIKDEEYEIMPIEDVCERIDLSFVGL